MHPILRLAPRLVPLLLAAFVAASPLPAATAPDEIRALWIQAWQPDLHTPQGIDQIIAHARAANFNTLIPQVRRRGDTLYFSAIEPRASGVQAGFDALQYMIEQARASTPPIEVHAWIVTYPIWNSHTPHPSPQHTLNKHPEWLMLNADGQTSAPNFQHDPGHPGVQQHLLEISMELIEKYEIDGLHFDYIRYPEHTGAWGYNPVSVERFQRLHRRDDFPAGNDPEWRQFRRDQVTQMLRRVYLYAMEKRPEVKISAATITWGHSGVSNLSEWWSSSAYNSVYQDWRGWMEEGILDLNIPMNYYRHHNTTPPQNHAQAYYNWSHFAKDHRYNRHLAIGPGIYLNTLANAIVQMRHSREPSPQGNFAQGSCGYVYHVTNNQNLPFSEFRKALTEPSPYDPVSPPMFALPAGIPEMPWKTHPTTGHLKGYVRDAGNGQPVDGATVFLSGEGLERALRTDAHGFYGFVDLPPGDYAVRAAWRWAEGDSESVAVARAQVATLSLDLTIPPSPYGQLEGTVSNRINGALADAATVRAFRADGSLARTATTATDGSFRMVDLPAGRYSLTAAWSGSPAHTPPVMINLPTGGALRQDLFFAVGGGGVPGEEVILDNRDPGVSFIGSDWRTGTNAGGYGPDYRWTHTSAHNDYAGPHQAIFAPALPAAGLYRIDTWYLNSSNRTDDAPYTLWTGQESLVVLVNQRTGGRQWTTVFEEVFLAPASQPTLTIGNHGSPSVVMADAVRWTLLEPARPEFALTLEVVGEGRVEGFPADNKALHSEVLPLRAVGEGGFAFSHWEGNAWGDAAHLDLPVGAHLLIRAVFVPAWGQWLERNFTAEERSDPALIAPGADPFGHGISNLLKFAFGLDTRNPDRSLLPAARADDDRWHIVFRRRQGEAGLRYRVQFTSDFLAWHEDATRIEEIAAHPNEDGTETVTIRINRDASDALFLRLRVERIDD